MKFKVATFGEIMLRLSTQDNKKFIQSNLFKIDYGGGEANVAISLSNFGIESSFITKLPDNEITESVIKYLKSNGVDTENIILDGSRLGIYYLETGSGSRGPKVVYDRKYSSFSTFKYEELNIKKALKKINLLHVSGITPALSEKCKELNLKLVKEAKRQGILISFDFNYRSKLWSIEEARITFKEYLPYVDICFAGNFDIENILEINVEKNENSSYESILENSYKALEKEYPNIKYFSSTKRESNSADNNSLTGYLYNSGKLAVSKRYNFNIVDRIGGGDAFSAGIIYGILKKFSNEDIAEFGIGASVLKHTINGDANLVDAKRVLNFVNNNDEEILR